MGGVIENVLPLYQDQLHVIMFSKKNPFFSEGKRDLDMKAHCKEYLNEIKCQCASPDQRVYLKANPSKKYTIHSCTDLTLYISQGDILDQLPVRTALLVANMLEIIDSDVNNLEIFSDASSNRLVNISARYRFGGS